MINLETLEQYNNIKNVENWNNNLRSLSGYGDKVPTRKMIHYMGVWRRLYCRVWSNAGTCYILIKGGEHVVR